MTKSYQEKKAFLDQVITIYGRNAVMEALNDNSLTVHRLHLADSNKKAAILDSIIANASARQIELVYHSKRGLSRISKNSKQDQGVAADIICPAHQSYAEFLQHANSFTLLAVDGVTNPQNLGMIIRSVCASRLDGILLPATGNAAIGPLVIKASAGTVFKTPIIRCHQLKQALLEFKQHGTEICALTAPASTSLFEFKLSNKSIMILGNETSGVSPATQKLVGHYLEIPMQRDVESLNVAITAALVAFFIK